MTEAASPSRGRVRNEMSSDTRTEKTFTRFPNHILFAAGCLWTAVYLHTGLRSVSLSGQSSSGARLCSLVEALFRPGSV